MTKALNLIGLTVAFSIPSFTSATAQVMIDSSTIVATAGSTYNDSGVFDVSNLLDGETAEGSQDAHLGTHYLATEGTFQETIGFVFDGAYELTALKILNTSNSGWNDSETDFFTIATSTDGGATYSAASAEIPLQDFSEGFQEVPVSAGSVNAVQLVIRNEDADDQGTNDVRVGLNEVQFFRNGDAVPEPSSCAFLALGALLVVGRRKR